MKIAIVCKNLSFITGGPRLIFGLSQYLKQLGEEIEIYAEDAEGEYFEELLKNIPVHVVKPDFAWVGPSPRGLLSWIKWKIKEQRSDTEWAKKVANMLDPNLDILNIHDIPYRVGYFYKKRNPKVKVVWQENIPLFVYVKRGKVLHDLAGSLYWKTKNLIDQKYYEAMDATVVLDELTKKRREARGQKNVSIIRAGIDFEKFYAPVKDFSDKASRKEVNLFSLGALNAVRRFDNVINAVKHLRDWGYNARLKVVCKNVWHEDQCQKDLLELRKNLGLDEYVELNFDGLPEAELVKTFQSSDIFVQAVYAPPPAHQGWGLVNFEAMAAGIPLIVVRSSSATEVLKEGETALFFDPLNSEQIAKHVKFLIDNPNVYDRLARAGQEYVKENQSWKKYAEETRQLFQKLSR